MAEARNSVGPVGQRRLGDERDEFHPALPGKAANCPRKIGIVSTSVVTSAPLSDRNTALVEQLLAKRFSCVIWDEAHRIRPSQSLARTMSINPPEKKLLYKFAEQLAGRTKTMLLATATPVQLHPMELWDLLNILSVNNPQVLAVLMACGEGRWAGDLRHCRRPEGPRSAL